MSIKDLFMSGDKKKRISHVCNLVALSRMDGVMTPDEQEVILEVAEEAGMTQEELDKILEHPEEVKFYLPRKKSERIEELYDLVMLMMVDGDINEMEMALCHVVAEQMKFDPEVIDAMVSEIMDMIVHEVVFDAGIQKIMEDIGVSDEE